MANQDSLRETTSTSTESLPRSKSFGHEQYDSFMAAEYLGYKSPDTLRNARHTGKLAGVTAPKFIKRGAKVFYRRAALDEWLSQFQEQTCTSGRAA